jgi:hypothetical protein
MLAQMLKLFKMPQFHDIFISSYCIKDPLSHGEGPVGIYSVLGKLNAKNFIRRRRKE